MSLLDDPLFARSRVAIAASQALIDDALRLHEHHCEISINRHRLAADMAKTARAAQQVIWARHQAQHLTTSVVAPALEGRLVQIEAALREANRLLEQTDRLEPDNPPR